VTIALYGGIAASVFLAFTALCGWSLTQPGVAGQAGAVYTLQLLGFAAGGFANVVTFGLLMAGVSVTCGFSRLLPRWLVIFGIVLALCCELSWFSMVIPMASIFLPLGRYLGFIWLLFVAFRLPRPTR
jgi:hypothetical protein